MDNDEWIFIPASAKSSMPHGHPLPVPQSRRQNMPRSIGTPLQLGGLPLPPSRPRPKSVQGNMPDSSKSVRDTQQGNSAVLHPVSPPVLAAPNFPKEKRFKSVSQNVSPQSQLLRLKSPSESPWLVTEWQRILRDLGQASSVFQVLSTSEHSQAHAARLLDQFAPSTLLRYFSAWDGFHRTIKSLHIALDQLTESQLADALVTISLSKKAESSAGCQISIKAIRWISTHAGVSSLSVAWNPIIESFLRSRIPKELKESIPFSLYTLVQMERRMLMSSCPISELILIGSILICTWASLRFADAQRCSFASMCFDGTSLRGSCWRTKTSSRGQPWGLIAAGFLSLGEFNWVERWLVTMDMLWHTARSTDMDMQIPDFLFPKMGPEGIALPWQPMTYAEGLHWIRRMTSLPWKTQQQSSQHWTAHSMKSTLLSWGSQMIASGQVSQEERLPQGHHRQSSSRSLRVYSRDDVHGQLSFQTKLIEHVRRGGRFMTPQHRGSQHPLKEPNVQMEFFRKASGSHAWRCFTSDANQNEPVGTDPTRTDARVIESSDSSSTSSSDSADSSESEALEEPIKKRAKPPATAEVCDELLLAASTSVQHAMIKSSQDWHPYFF